MAKIHMLLQGKGGVGKSLIASVLAQYKLAKGQKPLCIDTDPVNATFFGFKALKVKRLELMDGYRCCVSWFHHQDFLSEFEKMRPVSDQIFVVDRDRLSCSGGVSAAHLAAFLIDRHLGRAAARKALSILMIDEPMEGDRPQPGLPLELHARDPLVRRAREEVKRPASPSAPTSPPCAGFGLFGP